MRTGGDKLTDFICRPPFPGHAHLRIAQIRRHPEKHPGREIRDREDPFWEGSAPGCVRRAGGPGVSAECRRRRAGCGEPPVWRRRHGGLPVPGLHRPPGEQSQRPCRGPERGRGQREARAGMPGGGKPRGRNAAGGFCHAGEGFGFEFFRKTGIMPMAS